MPNVEDWRDEQPLPKITCTSSDCENDLHSFLRMRPQRPIIPQWGMPRVRN